MTKGMNADNLKVSLATVAGITSAALTKFVNNVNPFLDFLTHLLQVCIAAATFLYILHKLRGLKKK